MEHEGPSSRERQGTDAPAPDRDNAGLRSWQESFGARSVEPGQKDRARADAQRPKADPAPAEPTEAGSDNRPAAGQTLKPLDPVLSSIIARLAYYGFTGKLHVQRHAVTDLLAQAGSAGEQSTVGKQLLNRMRDLEGKGWSFGDLTPRDPYLDLASSGPVNRWLRMFTTGGYHHDYFQDVRLKRVTYNSLLNVLGGAVGSSYGSGDPVKHSATILAHELAHEDGTLYAYKDWKALQPAEQQTLAKRLLATETRAILGQLNVADAVGDSHVGNETLRLALRRGDLGGFIYDQWGKGGGPTYGSFSTLERKEAVRFVNEYMEQTFGQNLFDPKTGRVRSFDIDAGLGKLPGATAGDIDPLRQIGTISGDIELAARMNSRGEGVKVSEGWLERLSSESGAGGTLGHGLKTLGALGLLAAVTDVHDAFLESTRSGLSRLGRMGVDWAGFELGNVAGVAGCRVAAGLFPAAPWPVKLLPVVGILSGIGSSHLADKYVDRELEEFFRKYKT